MAHKEHYKNAADGLTRLQKRLTADTNQRAIPVAARMKLADAALKLIQVVQLLYDAHYIVDFEEVEDA